MVAHRVRSAVPRSKPPASSSFAPTSAKHSLAYAPRAGGSVHLGRRDRCSSGLRVCGNGRALFYAAAGKSIRGAHRRISITCIWGDAFQTTLLNGSQLPPTGPSGICRGDSEGQITETERMIYFAYGSNMLERRLTHPSRRPSHEASRQRPDLSSASTSEVGTDSGSARWSRWMMQRKPGACCSTSRSRISRHSTESRVSTRAATRVDQYPFVVRTVGR